MERLKLGFAVCGSFCTYERVIKVLEILTDTYDVTPILSGISASTDTRFGTAASHITRLTDLTGHTPIMTIREAEPIGPKKLLDLLVIAPCTGNTLAKLACGITDTSVTMAAKAHLRSNRPLVLALASNDALSANLKNVGTLLSRKSVYFVPMEQDEPIEKPHSLIADFDLLPETLNSAMLGKQYQRVFK